ncbi:hypothetical protein FK268_20685 [Tsukamurella sputi]|uniref:Uncharacterized protein n=1 Tax=Tsukamurella sputi TaxID=2591848 RepID=A0A5C5RGQ8_9ACTN|nr:hypothetical protein [Tsukamurella sputi]TWS22197.1 hypothetical protein FK268_20685 [Tsukamurella sputi]
MDDDDIPGEAVSARERLRSGNVETPPPDMRRTRRKATVLFLLAFVGAPVIGVTFLDSDPVTKTVVGLLLAAYVVIMGYLMVRTIIRR